MDVRDRSWKSLRGLVPLLAVVACCAGCSSPSPKKSETTSGALKVPVTVPANCRFGSGSTPTAHVFIGLKATAKAGVTEKQANTAIGIPNDVTMPCASGTNYTVGPPVAVSIYFLKGATVANQNRAASTLRSSGQFSVVTVVPQS
jgi:hypothetical protein